MVKITKLIFMYSSLGATIQVPKLFGVLPMNLFVIKRDGSEEPYQPEKISRAISLCGNIKKKVIEEITNRITETIKDNGSLSIETIQDMVENGLMASKHKDEAKEYIRYRKVRTLIRESEKTNDGILRLIDDKNEYLKTENSNKNHRMASTQRDYIAGEVSKDVTMRLLLPNDVVKAHQMGAIHFHDADYFLQHEFNCCLVNLEDILQNGTVINGTMIEKPHTFSTACNIATQVAAIIASNQYGGQTMSLAHLAPFVALSRTKIQQRLSSILGDCKTPEEEEFFNHCVEQEVSEEISRGVQTMQYQINTLNSSNGQTPFITLFAYLNEAKNEQEKKDLACIIAEVFKQRIKGVKNETGAWVSPAFPKLIYVLEEDNCKEGTEYWWLTELAAKCTVKRLVPDYISEKKMLELKGYCFPCMGCRSFLSPWFDEKGNAKFYGRFNMGVVTLNLPYVALKALEEKPKDSMKAFWEGLDDLLEICHKALQARYKRLKGTHTEISPLHWNHGALARLPKGSTIDSLLTGGYATISLGYAGLYEAVKALLGTSHTEEKGKNLALTILMRLNLACEKWKAEENIGYSVYGTPLESTTYKFAKAIKKFAPMEGVNDHDYITNSYHVNVREEIDPFTKLSLEAEFQKLSQGGCISYVETSNLQKNLPAALEVIKYIYDHIMYAELNTKSDYCQVCGSYDEIKIVEDGDKLVWECPHCGNRDQSKMNVTRRTCGYLGSNFWNQGRTSEIKDRYVHLGETQKMEI